jgi:cytochrome P450
MLAPIIKERQKISPDSKNKPQDMIQWIMDNCEPSKRSDTYYITKTQMLISLVAIHTTTMTMAQVMFDLIAHPEYIDILREEIQQVRPDSNAEWTKQQIADLKKTDSFMKESQRFRPPGLVTMNRQVETNFKLSNGLVLEKGMHIGVAAASNALDPEYFNDPEKFDGLRFYKLRTDKPGNDSKYQVRTLSVTVLFLTFLN